MTQTLLAAAGILLVLPGAMVALHYTVLALASVLYRQPHTAVVPHLRFLMLIPAHNEEAVLGRTLASVEQARRPGDLVLVVDDRSTDRTAEIARGLGALLLRRGPDQVPGRSAARQDGIRLAMTLDWDAIAMIDADSMIEPSYLEACEGVFACGAQALQVRSEAALSRGVVAHFSLAAFSLQGVTIPRGRDRLGLSVRLKGTGMVVRRHLLESHGFRGPGAGEDLWLSNDLLLDGVVARHVDSVRLRSDSTRSLRTASGQRVRWEAGRMMAAREFLPRLLRRHDLAALEAALHLVTVPFALAVLSLALGAVILALAPAAPLALAALVLLALLAADLAIGLVQVRAPLATWLALLAGPGYVVWKVWVQARAVSMLTRHENQFAATPRE
jgi:cellulose synthase/poly-beta-1,6-N-acetylglucosamine synthase-like glycosyltransferase